MLQVHLLSPRPGWFEIDPEVLWDSVVKVVRNAIEGEKSIILLRNSRDLLELVHLN